MKAPPNKQEIVPAVGGHWIFLAITLDGFNGRWMTTGWLRNGDQCPARLTVSYSMS